MSLTRRSFLQMLGLTGIGVVASEAEASIPLFGGHQTGSALWVPNQNLLSGPHLVLIRTNTSGVLGLDDLARVMGGGHSRRGDARFPDRNIDLPLNDLEIEIPLEIRPGERIENAYYRACLELRKKFATLSQQRLDFVPAAFKHDARLVTVCYNSAHMEFRGYGVLENGVTLGYAGEDDPKLHFDRYLAETGQTRVAPPDWKAAASMGVKELSQLRDGSLLAKELRSQQQLGYEKWLEDTGDPRYVVRAEFYQGILFSGITLPWPTYSEQGEYPLDLPPKIDMDLVVQLDQQAARDPRFRHMGIAAP